MQIKFANGPSKQNVERASARESASDGPQRQRLRCEVNQHRQPQVFDWPCVQHLKALSIL